MNQKLSQPKGLYLLFCVEMWERFSYYGMRAILFLYMLKGLQFSEQKAGSIYGLYTGAVYFTPLIGGVLADWLLGQRRSVLIGGILIAAGQFSLAVDSLFMFYTGLGLLIVGNGFFKPNISTIVGKLYGQNDPRRDGAFTIFYMGINLGALFSPFVCGYLGENVDWHYGFFSAGVGMVMGLIAYVLLQKKYLGDIGLKVKVEKSMIQEARTPLTKEEIQRIAVILIMAFFVIFFWVSFEQAGSSLTLFAEQQTNRMIPFTNWTMPASWFQSINPLFIMILAPVMSDLWMRLGVKGRDPSTPMKFVISLLLLGISFVVMVAAATVYEKSGLVSVFWLLGSYFVATIAELCMSPIGLSLVTKLSPPKMVSMLMGTWFLSSCVANYAAGIFGGNYNAMDHKLFFSIPVAMAFGAALVLLCLTPLLKKWMHGVK